MELLNKKVLASLTVVAFTVIGLTACSDVDVSDRAVSSHAASDQAKGEVLIEEAYLTSQRNIETALNLIQAKMPTLPPNSSERLLRAEKELLGYMSTLEELEPLRDWEGLTGEVTKATLNDLRAVTNSSIASLELKFQDYTELVKSTQEEAIPTGENPTARMTRIQQETGLVINYDIGECAIRDGVEIAGGCYNWGDAHIRFTKDWFINATECQIRKTLAHEYRHYEQYLSGDYEIKDKDELEEDARANEPRGGC